MSVIVLLCLIGAIIVARKSRPASAKTGTSLLSYTPNGVEPDLLKVATFNIQTGKSLHGKRNLLASARVIAHADLVGVQEVYAKGFEGPMSFLSGQAERLARYGNFAWIYNATGRRWFREHRGNAILSKIALIDWRSEMLPDYSGKSFRNMTIARFRWQQQSFYFINTHLHTREGREQQLEAVLREFAKHSKVILLGDFNSRADTPVLTNLLKDELVVDAIAAAGLDRNNADRIDWILTKGFKVETGEMLEKGVSDHPYYQVSLSYA